MVVIWLVVFADRSIVSGGGGGVASIFALVVSANNGRLLTGQRVAYPEDPALYAFVRSFLPEPSGWLSASGRCYPFTHFTLSDQK